MIIFACVLFAYVKSMESNLAHSYRRTAEHPVSMKLPALLQIPTGGERVQPTDGRSFCLRASKREQDGRTDGRRQRRR